MPSASQLLECPPMHGGSHSSGSSASSMSSTFSDLGSSTSASSSSPPVSKTNAFFASPFSTRPPSPVPPPPPPPQTKPRSLTADFFAASVKPPSPPPSGKSFSSSAIHPSRIFPSRYTSTHGSSSARSPDFSLLNPELSMSDHARDRSSESESSIPSQTSFGRPRLPTPPQIPTRPRMHRDDTIMPIKPDDEQLYTPRPADFEPPILLRFERSLLLKKQKSLADVAANPPSPPPQPEADLSDEEEEEEPHPGSIISLSSPDLPPTTPGGSRYQYQSSQISPLALSFTIAAPSPIPASFRTAAAAAANGDRGTPTPKNPNGPTQTNGDSTNVPTAVLFDSNNASLPTSPSSPTDSHSTRTSAGGVETKENEDYGTPKLRLLRSLGHGAFSAVWLAEDLSQVPLTLVSKKSVRDLRRRASGKLEKDRDGKKRRSRGKERDPQKEKAEVVSADSKPTVLLAKELPPMTMDEKRGTEESSTPTRRHPSRLREGLRNMLSFTRSSPSSGASSLAHQQQQPPAAPPLSPLSLSFPMPPMPTLPTMPNTPAGSIRSVRSIRSDMSAPSQPLEQPQTEFLGVSRNPSLRSSPSSIVSELPVSESGQLMYEGNLRVPVGHQHHEHPPHYDYGPSDSLSLLRDSSLRQFSKRVKGTRPASLLGRAYLDERDGEMGEPRDVDDSGVDGPLSRHSSLGSNKGSKTLGGRLVAVKMTPRRPARAGEAVARSEKEKAGERKLRREEEERTRVGFVREVEVLKHISHPNITPLLAHLSTPSHHILVLPYLPGGDLLGLVNNDIAWGKLSESVLRRIWCELCKAVGWMHGVGLVHRDIKLENILLTAPTFASLIPSSPIPTLATLPPPPAPFIKLTDFGLSRFVEIYENGDAELLATRCGSEAYAAPELVTGTSGSGGRGVYDARRTDAWACGVVLYALVGRQLPFGEGVTVGGAAAGARGGSRIGGERGVGNGIGHGKLERRHWLMRIARGEWEWPGGEDGGDDSSEGVHVDADRREMLVGPKLVQSRGARRVVTRLLVRDPQKRARIGDLWDDIWMSGGEEEAWRYEERAVDEEQEREHQRQQVLPASHLMPTSTSAPAMTLIAEHVPSYHGYPEDERSASMKPSSSWSFAGEFGEGDSQDADMRFYDGPTGLEGFSGDFDHSMRHIRSGGEEEEEEEEEEECEQGYLFDHEGIDSITRQEVI